MLSHKGTRTIVTDRLILRRFIPEDACNMFKNWANDSDVTKFLTWKPHGNIKVTNKIIGQWIDEYGNKNYYNWAIELKEIGEVIGNISVVNLYENYQSCEIGYCMSKKYWKKGIMTESLKAVIDYLFSEVGFNRIEARHDTNNIASGKVMIKSGMKYEGTLRQVKIRDKEFYSLVVNAILKNDWLADKLKQEDKNGK